MTRFTPLLLATFVLLSSCGRKSASQRPAGSKATASSSGVAPVVDMKAPPPPEPGRAELTFSGAFSAQIKGEGTECQDDGGFSVLSSDIQGFGHSPEWSFLHFRRSAHFNVGPAQKRTQYSAESADALAAIVRDHDRFVIDDLKLTSKESGKVVRAAGFVACPPQSTVNQMPEPIAALLKSAAKTQIRPFSTFDFGRARDARSISAIVAKPAAESAVSAIRPSLPPGFAAFIGTTQWLGDEKHEGVELVVGPARDQFDILRLAHSDGVNYDLATEALVKKLRQLHATVPIDIFHAETDTIEFRLLGAHPNPKALAKELYEFCPDAVDQGVGTLQAFEKAIAKDRLVYLWWD
jgi:hypothetical protein